MLDYLSHLLSAKTLHGIHSPFIYQLHDEVILAEKHYYDFDEIESFFRPLTRDKTAIKNLGAADTPKFFFRPTTAQIIRRFEPSLRTARMLYKLTDFLRPQTVAVVGCNAGIAVRYLSKGWHRSKIIGVEPCLELAQLSERTARDLPQLRIVCADWQTGCNAIVTMFPQLDLLWLNTRHFESMYAAWESCLPALHEGSTVIFHLRYRSKSMEKMWKKIIADTRVRFSIDLWQAGIVFLDPKQPKQHFRLRW